MNGESNFADKAPSFAQLDAQWVDDDKILEKSDMKVKADNNDAYKVQFSSFAQEQQEKDAEEERVRRLNGESNFADKAPELVQLDA